MKLIKDSELRYVFRTQSNIYDRSFLRGRPLALLGRFSLINKVKLNLPCNFLLRV